jgi:ferredoxin
MIAPQNMLWRGSRRFGNPVEHRYTVYERPPLIDAVCIRCKRPITFCPTAAPTYEQFNVTGGYRVHFRPVTGVVKGRGACGSCGAVCHALRWPESAYFKATVPEGEVWCWHRDQLSALLALIAGDKVTLRRLLKDNWLLTRFIARVPTYAHIPRNRARLRKVFSKLT